MAQAVVTNSPRVAELARRDTGGRTRIAVVPNYVDEAAFQELAPVDRQRVLDELGVPSDRTIVGCVANLRPVKDHDTLLRGVARMIGEGHDVHLVLVGDGERRDALVRLASDLEIRERVAFAGHRPHQPNLHHLFDISTLTSTDEAFSNSLLEAMAAANPVVATNVGGTPDAVVHGETGLLVPPANPGALASVLGRLLDDANLARRMGEAGRSRVREKFSPDVALTSLVDLYEGLLDRNTPGRKGGFAEDPEHGSTLTPEAPIR
jgi:glycosyltransferase involved in cell wall biosynthesis